jgi:branched-chain amino acid transport system ATP-binding protein
MTQDLRQEFAEFFVRDLRKAFGGVQAVRGVSFELEAGQIVGLIGPNGAGKTTIFNLITGLDEPDGGEIYYQRDYITRLPAYRVARLGIARTFQNIRLLGHLSVLDNVKIAYHAHLRYSGLEAVLRLGRFRRAERAIEERSRQFLEIFGLQHAAAETAAALPYGQRRKLEMARALATEAKLLLLDEPAAGLNPQETSELAGLIRRLRDEFRVTVLLIEHDMRMVMSLCDHVVVINFGAIIAQGPPATVKEHPGVIEAYLGRPREAADG